MMMDGIIKRYKLFLFLGLILVLFSFALGIVRTFNEATLQAATLDTDAYFAALAVEYLLLRYSEIIPLFGLGLLKLGIGFAIATIVLNLKATSESAGKSLSKVNMKPPEMRPPFFARVFPMMLILGILIELGAVIVAVAWMMTGSQLVDLMASGLSAGDALFDSVFALDHVLEILAEPIEGLGVAFLIGGIAFGLATIVLNLSRQATIMPRALTAMATGQAPEKADVSKMFPKPYLLVTIVGIFITASGFLPIALIRAFVDSSFLASIWETWMFLGIAVMLFSIAFWLVTIIKWLRAQRENLGTAISKSAGIDVPSIGIPMKITKLVPILAIIGLLWMIGFLGLAGIADGTWWKPLVRPGKAISLALIFTGIGLSLMTIVVNLRLTALSLPGAFSRIVAAIKGESVEGAPMVLPPSLNMAPKKLFLGIIVGAIIIFLGTFPLAWIRVVTPSSDPMKLMLEHFIGPLNALGVGLIFFFIGMFFSLIVTFVKGRRQLIGEGVETCVYYTIEKQK